MSSRLFQTIREDQALCYDISTDARKYRDSGGFIIHLGLDSANIIIALKSIFRQLEILKKKLVSKKELSRAKDYLSGQLSMSLERPQGRMFFLADSFQQYGKVRSEKDIVRVIESVTPEDIRLLSNKIFSFDSLAISCIGDLNKNITEQIHKTIGSFK
jgi:predicted Zn-dependent peptidase